MSQNPCGRRPSLSNQKIACATRAPAAHRHQPTLKPVKADKLGENFIGPALLCCLPLHPFCFRLPVTHVTRDTLLPFGSRVKRNQILPPWFSFSALFTENEACIAIKQILPTIKTKSTTSPVLRLPSTRPWREDLRGS